MPKLLEDPHFPPAPLVAHAHQQPLGLIIRTNDPATFKRRMYAYMAANPALKLRILTGLVANTFLLVKPEALPA